MLSEVNPSHPLFSVTNMTFEEENIPWNKGLTKETDDRVKVNAENRVGCNKNRLPWNKGLTKETDNRIKDGWNKGLTKETDERVKRIGEKVGETMLGRTSWNKGLTKEDNDSVMAISFKKTGHTCPDVTKEAVSKAHKGVTPWNKGVQCSEETRRKISESNKRNTGKDASNWKGGISFEPYCPLFNNNLKERVREYFNRHCYLCNMREDDNGSKLCVHHANYDKMVCCNDVKPLFVPLCRSCHTRTNGNREFWEEYFTASLNFLTDGECHLPKEM